MKAIVIGSGIAGLATSVRLALQGYVVEVFEANSYIGGKLAVAEDKGYRFDLGPSLFTMPHYVTELFELAGKRSEDYFTYDKHDTACHYFWEDGTTIKAASKPEEFAREVAQQLHIPEKTLIRYLNKSAYIYRKTGRIFLEKSLHKLNTWLSWDVLTALSTIWSYNLHTSLHGANKSQLHHPKLIQLFDRFATYNGSSPYLTPGIMQIIPHLEHNIGTFFPKEGMVSIPQSVYKLAQDLGVRFHLSTLVEKIIVNDDIAQGVEVAGKRYMADVVVSNMDVVPTYRKLLHNYRAPEKILQYPRSSSALIFYWGIKGSFEQLDLHNILFSNDYKKEFQTIFKYKTLSEDPTVYIHISSKLKPDDAPEGCENWFVMINTPGNTGQDWDVLIAQAREAILKKIKNTLKIDVRPLIETESILDPRSIEQRTRSYQGSLYGAGSNGVFSAFLRHPNFSQNIKNLYFCGGSVHPGGGIPLSLLSAKICSELIEGKGV